MLVLAPRRLRLHGGGLPVVDRDHHSCRELQLALVDGIVTTSTRRPALPWDRVNEADPEVVAELLAETIGRVRAR
jgi:hypothetical protein